MVHRVFLLGDFDDALDDILENWNDADTERSGYIPVIEEKLKWIRLKLTIEKELQEVAQERAGGAPAPVSGSSGGNSAVIANDDTTFSSHGSSPVNNPAQPGDILAPAVEPKSTPSKTDSGLGKGKGKGRGKGKGHGNGVGSTATPVAVTPRKEYTKVQRTPVKVFDPALDQNIRRALKSACIYRSEETLWTDFRLTSECSRWAGKIDFVVCCSPRRNRGLEILHTNQRLKDFADMIWNMLAVTGTAYIAHNYLDLIELGPVLRDKGFIVSICRFINFYLCLKCTTA